jgi:sulfate permease, SulP family
VTILRIHGPFLFGATEKLADALDAVDQFGPVVILRLRNMTALDATGVKAIEEFSDALANTGRTLLVCGALPQPARLLAQPHFHRHVPAENILPNVQSALSRAEQLLRHQL